MTVSGKKNGLSFYLGILAAVLGAAGVVTMVVSSTMSSANRLFGLSMLVVLGVLGIAAAAALPFAPDQMKRNSLLNLTSVVAAIALFTVVIGRVISSRILLISGLYSYNAANMVGWSVFYVTVASLVCFLAAILFLIIKAFLPSGK